MAPIWKSCLAKFYFINLSIHQDPKNNWRVPFKLQNFARFSLVSLSIHPRSRRGAERIDQQQQQPQQSVASAILATAQQSVRNTTTLIFTPNFRSASTFPLWG